MPANNLTPQQLEVLMRAYQSGGGSVEMDGWNFVPAFNAGDVNRGQGPLEGFYAYDLANKDVGDPVSWFDPSGNYTHESQIMDTSGFDPLLGMFLASALGMAAFLPGGFAAGGAAGGGAGAGALEAAPGFTPGAAGGGSFGVLDGSALAAEGFMPSATGGTFGVIDSTVPWGASSTSLMGPAAQAATTGATGAGAGAGTGTGAGAGTLANALNGTGGLLGPAAAVVGGLLGSQGTEKSETNTRDIPAWMNDYIRGGNGKNGLLPTAYDLFQQQSATGGINPLMRQGLDAQLAVLQSPAFTAGYDAMRRQGMGLLNVPIAGNPFARGYTGMFGGLTPRTGMGAPRFNGLAVA